MKSYYMHILSSTKYLQKRYVFKPFLKSSMLEIEGMFLGRLFQHFGPYTLNKYAANVLLCTDGTIRVFSSGEWDHDQTIYSLPTDPLNIWVHCL